VKTTTPILPKEGFDSFSERGWIIHSMCHILEEEEEFAQKDIPSLTKRLISKKVLPPGIKPIKYESELSQAKKVDSNTAEKRRKEIKETLEAIMQVLAITIQKYPTKANGKVIYQRAEEKSISIEPTPKLNKEVLVKNGLTGIVPKEPFHKEKVEAYFNEASELRILQSSFYNWREVTLLLKDALEKGKLSKVQILLGQPYSQMTTERAHTFGLESENQFNYMNGELEKSILGIIALVNEFKGKKNPNTNKPYEIQLRLYYQSTAIPLYQWRKANGDNMVTLMGVFWQHKSSYGLPHFEIKGSEGDLIATIDEHFETLWQKKAEAPRDNFNWYLHLGRRKTMIIHESLNHNQFLTNIKAAYELKPFSNYSKTTPNWIYFQCQYYNYLNKPRQFLLQIDPEKRIAKISRTYRENTYYGVVSKLHNSYTVYFHTKNHQNLKRTIFLNIPVGEMSLDAKEIRFAIYNNSDVITGSPYAHIMLLRKLASEEAYVDIMESIIPEYFTELMDKKIFIPSQLWNPESEDNIRIKYNYSYYYDPNQKDIYYEKIATELAKAKAEIYFLGHGPLHFPEAKNSYLEDYLKAHYNLLVEHGIKITRVLLNKFVNKAFVDSLIKIKENPEIADLYQLYVPLGANIPILCDICLVDPDDINDGFAILNTAATRSRNVKNQNTPIKMEVIRNNKRDSKILDNYQGICNDYIRAAKNGDFVKSLNTVQEINFYFNSYV